MKWLGLIISFLLTTALDADEPPRFVVYSQEGSRPPGVITQWKADGSLQVGQRPFAAGSWISLRQEQIKLPPWLAKNFVLLTNGERIPIDPQALLRADEERLYFQPGQPLQSGANPKLSIPLAYVVLLCLEPSTRATETERVIKDLSTGKRERDVVFLRDGDKAEGKLTSLNVEKLKLSGPSTGEIAMDQIGMIAWNTRYQSVPKQRLTFADIVLSGGGRLSVTGAHLDPTGTLLQGTTLVGAVEIPLQRIVAVELRQGPVAYLSDLEAKSITSTPYLDVSWPLVKDRGVTGEQLRLAANSYDKGLGIHAKSQVSYGLGGGYAVFEAMVGIDDAAPVRGQARIAVYVDGKEQELPEGGLLKAGADPVPIRVDVSGGQELRLLVDFGDLGDVGARVDWANARLVKK